jgi:hypothetical protein
MDTDDDEKKDRDLVDALLKSREGSGFEIHQVFTGLARALGAEADLLYVADRNQAYVNPNLKTARQFDASLVAVRLPGQREDETVLLDLCSGLDYGVVPWQYMGTHGMLMSKERPHLLPVPHTQVQNNTCDSRVRISFSEDNETILAKWIQLGSGQVGLDERRHLRSLAPDERNERMDRLCGASSDTDVLSAEVVGLDELGRDLELRCETESWDTRIDEEVGRYQMTWTGPWIHELPDFKDERRTHPVIFRFPRADIVTLKVESPDGFVPGDPPAPVSVETQHGRYSIEVTRNEDGFTVERVMVLFPIALPVDQYPPLRELLEAAQRGDRSRLVFLREELAR